MTGMLGGIARYLAGLIIAMITTPLFSALVEMGLDPVMANEFIADTARFIEMAVFVGLMFGTAKGLTFFKSIDSGAFAQRVWQRDVGRQIADIPASEAKKLIREQQSDLVVNNYVKPPKSDPYRGY